MENLEIKELTENVFLLIKKWQDKQVKYEALSQKYKDNEHNSKKFSYKAVATRDCWKELLSLIEEK